jgi:RES domain-containing protein
MKRRPRPPRIPSRSAPPVGGEAPPLIELERFSQASLRQWLAAESNLRQLHRALFFSLERQRQEHSAELIDALRVMAVPGQPFENWSRIVDWRYNLKPLSVEGSLKRSGGRFNIGAGIDVAAFTPFPALYVAQDYKTAFRERFAQNPDASDAELTGPQFALRTPESFTHVSLRGQLEIVIDVTDAQTLRPFAAVLSRFSLPREVRELARRVNAQRPMGLVRSVSILQRQLLDPYWRAEPVQFDLPANSQIFGRIAAAAGIHGIVYPSARHESARCLALFAQNWRSSASFVEVVDPPPPHAHLTRIDGTTSALQ